MHAYDGGLILHALQVHSLKMKKKKKMSSPMREKIPRIGKPNRIDQRHDDDDDDDDDF